MSQTGSDYLDQLLPERRVTLPTTDFSDYAPPQPTGEWDGTVTADVIAEQRGDRL